MPSTDDVERALAALDQTVQACRKTAAAPEPHALTYAEGFKLEAVASLERVAVGAGTHLEGALQRAANPGDGRVGSPGNRRRSAAAAGNFSRRELETLVRSLRASLQEADARLQASAAEASLASSSSKTGREKQSKWQQDVDADVEKLKAENERLERSVHQAALEERRLTDAIRAEPERAEAALATLRSDIQRLEKENRELSAGMEGIKAELSQVRDAVETQRGPRGAEPSSVSKPAEHKAVWAVRKAKAIPQDPVPLPARGGQAGHERRKSPIKSRS
eukprot:TRINITY_DN44447_c0_g1_i1.p1 TRINITY_DN44447_c0_g1~~TRINITY_DN44447_c0_g1_i1.p1  ORF type:complete len:278 (-),score=73.71 TRINITY_DN44447_c0_g1_i1:86-919(-)